MQHAKKPGFFITIEGLDGCGKTILVKRLNQWLKDRNVDFVLTKEPGGSDLGRELRAMLQHQKIPLTPVSEYLLFAADRAQHFETVVIPALEKGKVVISDRSGESSLVYQGYGMGIDIENIKTVNSWARQGILPDLILYLKIDIETGVKRVGKRMEKLTAFEKRDQDYWQRVLQGYEEIFASCKRVCTIDATQEVDKVFDDVCDVLSEKLGLNN